MSREAHVRICGSRRVRFPPATRQKPMPLTTRRDQRGCTSASTRRKRRCRRVSTGGLIAAALVAQDGASRYFRGGFVFYTLESMATQLADASDVEFGERSATEQRARWVADCARA